MRYVPYTPMPAAARPLGSDFLLPRWSGAHLGVLDGGVLATATLGAVELWDVRAEHACGRFELSGTARALCAAGRWIAAADEGSSRVEIATASGELVASFAHAPCPHVVALSPDACWVAFGGGGYGKDADKRVHLGDVSTGALVAELKGGRRPVRSLAFSADGASLAAAIDASARVWSTSSAPKLGAPRVLAHAEPVIHVSFSPDGETLYTLTASEACAWSLSTGNPRWRFARPPDEPTPFCALARTEHGIAVALERTLLLLDDRGRVRARTALEERSVHALAAHGDTLFVADAFDHRVRRHALPSLARAALPGPDARLEALAVSPDERHALSCGWDGKAELWELASGRRIRELRGPAFPSGGSAQAGCFLPDGSVVIAFGPELRCFAPDRDEPVWSRRHEHGWDISLLVASRDGSVVVACDAASRRHYGHLSVIDAGSGHERSMKQLSWTVQHAQLDGDRVLLLGSAGALTLDPATGEIVKERRVEGSYWGTGMVLSPDGRTCTRPASRIVRETRWTVHDLERDEAVVTIDPGEGSYPAAFALDGAVLVVTTSDGLRYFDAASGAALGEVALGRRPLLVRSLRDRELVALDSGALYLVDRPAMEPARPERRAATGEDVLALFEVEPSADAWRQACAALERVDDPAVLEQVERACERWPDHLRTAPSGWIDDAISGRAQPRLRIVRTLRTKHLRSSGARALASIPDLRLAILDVKEGELDDADALALARRWPDLEELRLRRVGLGPKAAKGLASVPFTRLARLDLSGNALTGPSVAALLASPALARLRYLALDRNAKLAHPKSIEAFATSPHLAGLHALGLEFTGMPVSAIVRAEHLVHLRSLAIDGAMSDDDLAAIARAPHLARLEHLDLGSQHSVTAAGLAALEAHLSSLRTFSIYTRDRSVLAACPRLSEARERHRERLEAGHRSWGWLFERERIV